MLFEHQGADLTGAAIEAVKRLQSIGDFWGHDGAGRKFHEGEGGKAGYGARCADIVAEIDALATAYDHIGDRLVLMGRNVRDADWASVPRLPEIPR
jgi:hypothetical protein